MLIIFGGLSGSGKSTVAQALARRIRALYLRVDTVEQAIRTSAPLAEGLGVGPSGYVTVYRLATDNLRLGHTVIADSVNPLPTTRNAFRDVAAESGTKFIEVEIVCSDAAVHRHRAETRPPSVDGLSPPSWAAIQNRHYEAWIPDLRIDTSLLSVEQSVVEIVRKLGE
ncbi:kinase [Agrobacterium rubi]|uniref:AAA family ATPase n=1 Tax=Agrobacterium TaxID=357 RepID=UPI001E5601C8|nr:MULTISPECIES: AAA family ATPase [Agrobacterium]MCL6653248.1 kinase [Agrobacterium rubi]UHS56422.1 AAA family ATPase [Agrobacterium vaccinii]